MRILIVDDSASIRKIIKNDLCHPDYVICEASCGAEALKAVVEFRPDVITLDVDMPDMSGFEVANFIRASDVKYHLDDSRIQDIPIIFVTSSNSLEERTKGFAVGASDFIMKPFVKGEIATAVKHFSQRGKELNGLTALVVDDSSTALRIVKDNLEQQGITVLTAVDGLEALRYFLNKEDYTIDLIITDYHMPHLNGLELCRTVREKLGNSDIPIIFLTADNENNSTIDIFEAGATDYLVKPFLKEELTARLGIHIRELQLKKEQEKIVRELKIANSLKDEFLAVASHDLRSPLNGILGFSSFILDAPYLKTEERVYAESVVESGQFLLSLINDILDLALLNTEKGDLQFSKIDLRNIIESSILTLNHMASPKKISLLMSNTINNIPLIEGNRNALMRVINNLISNAIKFTNDHGKVTITLEKPLDGYIQIKISDTGIGIPQDKLPYLFDKFTRISKSGTHKEKSTGLGLSITKKLIEKHNGTVTVNSRVGEGTDIMVLLPVAR